MLREGVTENNFHHIDIQLSGLRADDGRLCVPRLALSHQSMGGNGFIVSFGEVMPMRLGRLQRQSRRAFWASAAPEVSTSELAGWCWARQTLIEKRALTLATGSDDPSCAVDWRCSD
jgi:hypothetical protein